MDTSSKRANQIPFPEPEPRNSGRARRDSLLSALQAVREPFPPRDEGKEQAGGRAGGRGHTRGWLGSAGPGGPGLPTAFLPHSKLALGFRGLSDPITLLKMPLFGSSEPLRGLLWGEWRRRAERCPWRPVWPWCREPGPQLLKLPGHRSMLWGTQRRGQHMLSGKEECELPPEKGVPASPRRAGRREGGNPSQ